MNTSHPMLEKTGDALLVIANRNSHSIDYYIPEELADCTSIMNVESHEDRKVTVPPMTVALLGRGNWT